jgi:DNA-directed RNA polymerase specialized sigma24 family protein
VPGPGSITVWLVRLKAGSRDEAVARLWAAYFGRLVSLARRHLAGRPRAADEEDVALSAFDSFVRAVARGRFPRLDDRDDLWQVLFVITARKAADATEAAHRLKRGGGRTVEQLGSDGGGVPSAEPDPAEAAALAEEVGRLLAGLGDPVLRQIAVWKLDGHTNEEIAAKLGRSVPTVERKLARIRQRWSVDPGPAGGGAAGG